jgi:hypothetical protein
MRWEVSTAPATQVLGDTRFETQDLNLTSATFVVFERQNTGAFHLLTPTWLVLIVGGLHFFLLLDLLL